MYRPLRVQNVGSKYQTSTMAKYGIDEESLKQAMDINYAIDIVNYIPYPYGQEKRKGLKKIAERTGANPPTLVKEFLDGVWIVGYSTKIEAYNETTDTWTTIKSDFSAGSIFDGERYGEYFFVCNGIEKIHRIDNTLAITEVAAAPICGGLKVIGARLHAFRLSTDESADQYSEVDDGSNPPFDAWSETTAADTGGTVNYRNGGALRSLCQLGIYTVALYDRGFTAWETQTLESGGNLIKSDVIANYTEDYGGARGAVETPNGIYYINEAGLWQLVAVGQTDTPMSKQQILVSKNLNSSYFKDIDQTNVDIVYDQSLRCVFVTCAKDSTTNNVVIGCKPELKNAMFRFNNWNINRFAKNKSGDLYGCSSVSTKIYKLFDGYDDDGLNISTEYYQEINLGTLFHAHQLNGLYAGGFLTSDDELKIRCDIFDLDGNIVYDKEQYLWTGEYSSSAYDEFGSARFGDSEFGGSFSTAGLVESFGGGSVRINNLQRLRIRITGGSKTKHILNWISVKTTQKRPIHRRNFTKITT